MHSKIILSVGLLAAAAFTANCGKKSKSKTDETSTATEKTEGSAIQISGQLNLASSASLNLAADVAELKVSCVTFSLPPVAGTGQVGADGKFSVSLDAAKKSFGCFIVDKEENVVATLVFKSSGKSKSKVALDDDTNMGAIKLDLDKGTAEVDVAQFETKIKDNESDLANAWDFSGTWKFAKVDAGNLPKGFKDICPPRSPNGGGEGGGGGDDCRGPSEGEAVYFRREEGKDFKPSTACLDAVKNYQEGKGALPTNCEGTTGTTKAFVASVWQSEGVFKSCGSKIGLSDQDAKTFAHVDLSGSGVLGGFTFNSSLVDGWKHPQAKTNWDIGKCEEVSVAGKRLWRCYGDVGYCGQNDNDGWHGCMGDPSRSTSNDWVTVSSNGYNDGAESKCSDYSGNPVVLRGEDWSEVNWMESDPSKEHDCKQAEGFPTGYTECNSYPKYKNSYIKCSNIHGSFDSSGAAIPYNRTIKSTPLATANQLCSTVDTSTEAGKMAQLRCYADGFHQFREQLGDSCYIRPEFDWSAKTAEAFAPKITQLKPDGLYLLEKANYSGAGELSFRQEEERSDFIDTGSGGVVCRVYEEVDITIKRQSDTEATMEFTTQSRNLSNDKDACKNAYSSGKGSIQKYYSKMLKQ